MSKCCRDLRRHRRRFAAGIGEGEIVAADWGRGDDPHGVGQAVQREG